MKNNSAGRRRPEGGSGDYTKERQAMLSVNSIDMIAERVKKRKGQPG